MFMKAMKNNPGALALLKINIFISKHRSEYAMKGERFNTINLLYGDIFLVSNISIWIVDSLEFYLIRRKFGGAS